MATKITAPERLYSAEILNQRALLYQQLPSIGWGIDTNTAIVMLILIAAGVIIWRR